MSASSAVAVIGPASWNQLVLLDSLPEPIPHMEFALDHWDTLGGTSAGKALHLHDLGRPTTAHVVVGDDAFAPLILDALGGAGVDVRPLRVRGPSERHLNLMTPRGERLSLYLATPAAPDPSTVTEVLRAATDAGIVVADLAPWTRRLVPDLAATGIRIWTDLHDYDGVDDFRMPFIEAASHVFLNADKLPDPLPVMHRMVDGGAEAVVCTLGPEGAVAVDARHRVHRANAKQVERVVDTNGAGDAFFAGFLHATLDGADLDAALTSGAGQATRALGSRHLSPLLDP